MKSFIFTALVLLFTAPFTHDVALAGRPDVFDCPCMFAMFDAFGSVECTSYVDTRRDNYGRGDYSKYLSFGESTGGNCANFVLHNMVGDQRMQVFAGTVPGGCSLDTVNLVEMCPITTTAQIRGCEKGMRILKRQIDKLPDCPNP